MPLDEAQQLAHDDVVIIKGCRFGPETTDTKVRETEKYTVYREG
jgi:hypothetical protein